MASVCVFCASSTVVDDAWLELARAAGRGLAERGHRVVSGGGCVGMMGTLADGARSGARTRSGSSRRASWRWRSPTRRPTS
jgi:predicted Rossmann-fold nucleotide-binding protein